MYNKIVRSSIIILKTKSGLKFTKNTSHCSKRNLTTKLVYSEYGNPEDVVQKVTEKTPNPSKNEVLIEVLASPINPVDINLIEGSYPIKKPLPAVAGYESVGRILTVGEKVNKFKEGDHVLPFQFNLGTWTTHMVLPQNILKQIPTNLSPLIASTLMVNPCTAYRMLKNFVKLEKGDTVIQNGSNSSCGQLILQLCKLWGVKTVNIVRNRTNIEELKQELLHLGATHVLTEEELRTTDLFKSGQLQKPKLGLNCVGGKSSLELIRKLDYNGTLVTYGGMSKQPVAISTSSLIFKNIKLNGFNINYWNATCDAKERDRMLDELILLFLSSNLKAPAYIPIAIDNFKEALRNKSLNGKKYVFQFTK